MNGRVDEKLRALIDVDVSTSPTSETATVTLWIDTAFNGYLVFSHALIEQLDLEQYAATDAILADGSQVTLESYMCYVDWFGALVAAQVIANDGAYPLLGTELLRGRILHVDYEDCELTLE